MADQTVSEGSIDPNPGNTYVIHCKKCGQIFLDDPDWAGCCPFCGFRWEDEN